jgi:hypothetical protein
MHKLGDLKVPFQKQKEKNLKVEKRQDSTAGCRIEYWRLAGGIAAL